MEHFNVMSQGYAVRMNMGSYPSPLCVPVLLVLQVYVLFTLSICLDAKVRGIVCLLTNKTLLFILSMTHYVSLELPLGKELAHSLLITD